MTDLSEHLQGILDTLPTKPGCYIMKNSGGQIIYVGKAINLRNRVRSYFHASAEQDAKTRQLVRNIVDIEWIVVGSELEALILEMNLIKKHRPRYNIRLKDDKRYPYIKIHWGDPYPKVTVTRQMVQDGSRYYGPYTSAWAVHQTLDVLRRIFPYLTCDRVITGKDPRACLYYDIKLCSAPCIGAVDQQGYRQMMADLGAFLEGKSDEIAQRLRCEMDLAAEELRFEQAAVRRDQLQAIDRIVERQKVLSNDQVDSDVIAMARNNGEACVQIFFIRSGKLIGREYFILEGTEDEADSEVVAEFIKQFYAQAANVPAQLLLPNEIEEARIIQEWLRSRRSGEKVEVSVPREGQPQELVQMATENAVETLRALRAQWDADTNRQSEALAELQAALQLSGPPNRIECYDISNTQGTYAVGSMVVFEQGTPAKKHYRRFNIQSVSGPDDFASMEEVLTRRFRRWQAAQEAEGVGEKPDLSFAMLPDLLMVDGGKGQLSRAVAVLERFNLLGRVPVVGLAKQQEELFLPGQSQSLLLPRNSQGLYLIQRVRDEAHRFAITAHRSRRTREGLASRLDKIPGIGPGRRQLLLKRFGSIERILEATEEELTALPGITPEIALALKTQLE
ncbi:excinuclease ABC subunit UvrC [Levilinea saccharolytica]|uniref:UvrABC system protein C n=1 Tax=Levilinea saccharolytica TaxID=229921 RepID=A0A0P6YXV3_9CHLR|nr:excinuclease ABC subunit UvrC [Levilinea saccharolytica]KPL90068.1 excinuclease ABC subunit C [Levilinea saccharolytica]GAP16187.1 excinuclease ABC subunit C [Levilinea saccharolytica]